MSDLIDAKLIIEKKGNKYITKIDINGKIESFSRYKFTDDNLNGKDCKIDKQRTKIIVEGKTYPPEQKAQNQNNQVRQPNRHQNQNRPQPQQAHSQTNNGEEDNLQLIQITNNELDTQEFTFNSKNIKFNKNDISQYFNTDLNEKFKIGYECKKNKDKPERCEATSMQTIFLPKDTRETFAFKPSQNFYLEINKLARFELSGKQKEKFIVRQDDKVKNFFKNGNYDLIKKQIDRVTKSYSDLGYILPKDPINKSIDWRLIVGLGNESVYETSITLHHIYGIPYIPGSAVKGVTRSYVITVVFGDGYSSEIFIEIEKLIELDKETFEKTYKTDQDLQDKLGTRSDDKPDPNRMEITKENFQKARKIFGNQNQQGQVIFFDAFPNPTKEKPLTIEPDIMNPHYAPYYSDKNNQTPPADYHNPVPIFFLTVKDAEFDFYLAVKPKDLAKDNDNLLDQAKTWLEEALTTHGIGAKTAVGYGYFN